MTRNLAMELEPVRVNFIAADFVDTPLSRRLLGEEIETVIISYARRFPRNL
jgi:hypothetical protein